MIRDGHIRLLPIHVANKIAAGEVVERPASVVKELVENSLDAGATRIDIAVSAGGRKLISVRDNGSGMNRDDALMSLERQATSKILDVDDIERINTLGFRGEAVPSIAAVSRFTLMTRCAGDDAGTRLTVNAGTVAEVADAGCPPGTLIEVRDLFCNVPARRKFLRAYATEESHIRTVFTLHALAHPDIGFSLTIDGREIYRFAPGATLDERVRDIFGGDFAAELIPIKSEINNVSVIGFVERPNRAEIIRRDQFVFVNGRPATASVITYALREAYPRAMQTHPAVILFISLAPELVDVNVHPTKREVRFRRPSDVRDTIISAISSAISISPSIPEKKCDTIAEPLPPDYCVAQPSSIPVEQSQSVETSAPIAPSVSMKSTPPPCAPAANLLLVSESQTTRPWKWFRFLAETASGYLLIETDSGLVTVNPRAARERIVFEKLMRDSAHVTQALLIPEIVRMNPSNFARIKNFADVVRNLGFSFEEFGTDTWKIDAVPQLLNDYDAGKMLTSIATDIAESGIRRGGIRWREEIIAKSLARSFSGRPVKFTNEGATHLIEELGETEMPYICPRGRPTMIFTSNNELDRKFSK